MVWQLLRVTVEDRIATLAITDGRRRNALSKELLEELDHAIDTLKADAFVLTGTGRYFCAGADVRELDSGNWRREIPSGPPLLFRRMTEDPRPFIAAVNGPAYGGGCELALACDYIALAEDSFLELPEASLGILPNSAVGLMEGTLPKHLLMQLLTGRLRLYPNQALALGIAVLGAPADAVPAEAARYLRDLQAHCSPTAFRLLKSALAQRDDDDWTRMAKLLAATDESEVTLGIHAMREHRPCDYTPYWAADRSPR